MSLLFNTVSRFVIAFMPRSNCLLIPWLQSSAEVILEPKKRNSVTASPFSSSICHEGMGPDAMVWVFFLIFSFKPAFSLSSFTLLKTFFSSSSLSAIQFSSVQSLSRVWLFAILWTAAGQASLSFTISWSLLKLMSIELVMPSNLLILCHPLFLLPSIFPSISVFSNESVLQIRWPVYWNFSLSIYPSNKYSGLISSGFTGLISLQSQGLSRVFSNTTVQKCQFFSTQLSLWSNSYIHTWLLERP